MLRLRTREWAELSNDQCSKHVDTEKFSNEQVPHYNFARQAKEFVAAIRDDKEPCITGEDGLKSLELALAIYRSAESGQSISLKGA
jgi:predicted dehydrogenase